jgi:type IV pilus assembly protein PilO
MAAKPAAASGSSLDRLPIAGKVGVGLILLALVGVLFYIVFYEEISGEVDRARQQEATLMTKLAQAKQSKEAYQKDLDEKVRLEGRAREQKKSLPDEPETPAFLSALQSVATISGVNLTSWTPLEEAPQEFFAKIPMKLTLSGRFHQIVKFFYGAGKLDRITNVEDIQIKVPTNAAKPGMSEEDGQVQVECLATAFRALRLGETGARRKGGPGK